MTIELEQSVRRQLSELQDKRVGIEGYIAELEEHNTFVGIKQTKQTRPKNEQLLRETLATLNIKINAIEGVLLTEALS